MSVTLIRGDARALPLADDSVDLIVTSPPYWSLRDYQDGDQSLAGQIGAEPTPGEYLDALWECTREWTRVLKPEGSLWINLGDKYSTGNSGQSGLAKLGEQWAGGGHSDAKAKRASRRVGGMPPKSLLGLPWMYAAGCTGALAHLGGTDPGLNLILRAEVIWAKPNGLPESVTDRVRRSHEQWFHFVKQPRYFSAVDEIRTPHMYPNDKRHLRGGRRSISPDGSPGGNTSTCNPLGALPGSVWEVASQPLNVPDHLGVDHFAAFPMEFPRRIIRGWSPPGICTACGEGRRPVTASLREVNDQKNVKRVLASGGALTGGTKRSTLGDMKGTPSTTITGYACACPEPTAPARPAVVLDPFSGTGTTPMVAKALGRIGIGIDRSADYCRIGLWRANDPDQLAKASGMPKPARPVDGQEALDLGELTA